MGTHPIFESDFDCLTDEIGAYVKFEWLNQDQPVATDDNSLTIKTTLEKFTSRLVVNPATTADSGKYSCCGQAGDESVCTSANVDISFGISNVPDSIDYGSSITSEISCFDYPTNNGGICQKYLSGKSVHAETLEGIYGIENQIKTAFNQLHGRNKLSQRCEQFAPGAFCHYLLPTCGRNSGNQVKLCRADCEMLKNS